MADRNLAHDEPRVPDDIIPHGYLPPLRYRDLPEPVPIRKMIGPGIVLAGLALGSGEFVLWPYITYQSGFVFFWACLLGVSTQYFLNMEIIRWTLATGESAITGFCRLSRHWAWIFLALNLIPWMLPAWAKGAAQILAWTIWGAEFDQHSLTLTLMSIGGLLLCGGVLTAGPVIYETVEKTQMVLVSLILILVVVLACAVVRPDAIAAQLAGSVSFQTPVTSGDLNAVVLLGAIAFAGAGGTLNLSQSNYIKDKGYGMGHYIGRLTSPITGQEEAVSEIGYHFPATPENLKRWRRWWRAAGLEHFISFYLTCLVCLVLLTLISYSLFYLPDGTLRSDATRYASGMDFIWGEAVTLHDRTALGGSAMLIFLAIGVATLLTTEFGILDAISRVATDIVKTNWLNENVQWTESRLYYLFLWGLILFGSLILLLQELGINVSAFMLFKFTAAMNGGVMFLYSITLLQLNRRALPDPLRTSWWRSVIMVWSVIFFGFFTAWVASDVASQLLR